MLSFLFHCQEGLVCMFQWKNFDLRADMELMSDRKKVARILPSHIGHTAYLALAPKQFVIVKAGHMVEMNGIDGHHSTFTQTGEGTYYDLATGSEGNGTIERHGRLLIFLSDPGGAERDRAFAMGFASGHNIDFAFPGFENSNR